MLSDLRTLIINLLKLNRETFLCSIDIFVILLHFVDFGVDRIEQLLDCWQVLGIFLALGTQFVDLVL